MPTDEPLTEQERLHAENEALRATNDELRRRVEAVEALIATLRADALARRAEVRRLAESLPVEMSRRALLRTMIGDAVRHPDKAGVLQRALRKLGRAPRRAARLLLRRR